MSTGEKAVGPVAVVENETTIIVPASRDAIRQPDGCIDIIIKGADQ
jgi:N-methylhydantoinase A